tara:strand:- start:105 stop:473 length:369 start_codon:yes stop_codon:yes gene_type:complete
MSEKNGKAGGFQLPARTVVFKFENTDYEGAKVKARLDVPLSMFLQIQDAIESEKALDVFTPFGDMVVESWNIVDRNEKPIPADGEGMLQITVPFATLLMSEWAKAVGEVPSPLDGKFEGIST